MDPDITLYAGLALGVGLPAVVFYRALLHARGALYHEAHPAHAGTYFRLGAHVMAAAFAATWLAATLSSLASADAPSRAQANLSEGLALFLALMLLNEAAGLWRGAKKGLVWLRALVFKNATPRSPT
jgi:hypothetical protein